MNIPIGIVTKDRPVYLNETLNSILDTNCPIPTVYDDASEAITSRRFLDTSDTFTVQHEWPTYQEWIDAGLSNLKDNPTLHGIDGKVDVIRIDSTSVGVVVASCEAILDLFEMNPEAPAIILLQDDVIVVQDWYEKLVSTFNGNRNLGILAGMHLNYRAHANYYTAQCYLITKSFFKSQRTWFEKKHTSRCNFDVKLCNEVNRSGFKVDVVNPYICQHIGVVSKVRPHRPFKTDKFIRMGLKDNCPLD